MKAVEKEKQFFIDIYDVIHVLRLSIIYNMVHLLVPSPQKVSILSLDVIINLIVNDYF